MSLSRYPGAPVKIGDSNMQDFETCNDVSNLQIQLGLAKRNRDTTLIQSTKSKIGNVLRNLGELKLQERRAEYFQRVNGLRAKGLPTVSPGNILQEAEGSDATHAIAHFMMSCTRELDLGCSVEQRAKDFMELLVDYLAY